ncbi:MULTISPECIES: hypothetical protein [Acidobacteriaceae]|uniref:hypothetical protein n=1 Tax=Acidobacteriaceae TaxID=204434 RepID=UPI00131E3F56|nr:MULTISPECIES: hypothetical protein [Acidobacteriaceae]MDW5267108.1 hypothetical protein [Edaphobacter sp.]
MRRLLSFVAVLLLVASAAPVMACVTNLAMSQTESACCRSMHGQCGEMAKMGCCQTVVHNDSPQAATETASLAVHWTVFTQGDSLTMPVVLDNPVQQTSMAEHSPPGLLIARTTVLRI